MPEGAASPPQRACSPRERTRALYGDRAILRVDLRAVPAWYRLSFPSGEVQKGESTGGPAPDVSLKKRNKFRAGDAELCAARRGSASARGKRGAALAAGPPRLPQAGTRARLPTVRRKRSSRHAHAPG